MQFYSDPSRESNPYALPDAEVFYLTAHEAAELDEDLLYEYHKRPDFRLASMNDDIKQKMLDAIVKEQGLTGGWYYWACLPGCLPDGPPIGPYETEQEAIAACQEDYANDDDTDC